MQKGIYKSQGVRRMNTSATRLGRRDILSARAPQPFRDYCISMYRTYSKTMDHLHPLTDRDSTQAAINSRLGLLRAAAQWRRFSMYILFSIRWSILIILIFPQHSCGPMASLSIMNGWNHLFRMVYPDLPERHRLGRNQQSAEFRNDLRRFRLIQTAWLGALS